ncbi:hypothetical protein PGB90_008901 [Kerria lacca]
MNTPGHFNFPRNLRADKAAKEAAFQAPIDSFAAGLVALDLKKGDHIAIWAPNVIEWYISILAIIKAGFVAVNLNPLYECPELESSLKKTDVKALIIGDTLNERNYYRMMEKIIPNISSYRSAVPISCDNLPLLKILIVISSEIYNGAYRWCDVLTLPTNYHRLKLTEIEKEICIHDSCNIQFTSGTTGMTKGATLSHYNVVNNSYFIGKRMLLMKKHHVICLQVPLFHTFGTVLGIFISLHYGATLVIPSLKFSPSRSIESIIKYKCTVVYGTPTMYIDLITIAQNRLKTDPSIFSKLSSLEIAVTSGALCTPDLFKQMMKTFNLKKIYSGYGMTEVSPIAFFSKYDDSEYLITTTVGSVLDHTEVKVVNKDFQTVPFGVAGEVCFKGYGVMKGYYNEPETTKRSFLDDGWLRSGDKLILMENGYGKIVGRIKDTILRGGENIEPGEIEIVLMTHPDIVNVQVYGVSDDRLGEVVATSIVKREHSTLNEEDVKKFCEGKFASYKIPKYVKFVQDYPRTASGKIQKVRLREMLERELKLR